MSSETAAQVIAGFVAAVAAERAPEAVVAKARACITYGFGIGLMALRTPYGETAARAAAALDGGTGAATVLCTGDRGTVHGAVLANAALLHGLCQEDTSGTAHLGVVVLPVLLALAESRHLGTGRFLDAVIAGYEVGGVLERTLGRDSMRAGFRASPLYGAFAATAAAAKLLDLPAERTAAAIANCTAFCGGTLQSIAEGTDEWRYQVGMSGVIGVTATMLADAGSVSAAGGLEGEQGFARCYAHRAIAADDVASLGRDWSLPKVTFKPYPVCAHNQTVVAVGAALARQADHRKVESLTVRINPYLVPGLLNRGPFSRISETLLSTYFCAAAAMVGGSVTYHDLQRFDDPAITRLIARMQVVTDERVPFPAAQAEARLADGRVVAADEMRRFEDYSLSYHEVLGQLGRMASESGIATAAVADIDRFTAALPEADYAAVRHAFATARHTGTAT